MSNADPSTPLSQHHDDHPETVARNSRNGLILFAIYVMFYGGFMALSAFRPDLMAQTALAGVNLAIIYGLALIVVALILAAVYMYLCSQ